MTGEGYPFSDSRTPPAVEQLLRGALREDPDFVWALILLAHAVHAQGGSGTEIIGDVERAATVAVPGVDRYIAEAEHDAFRARYSTDHAERTRYFDQSLAKFDAALQLQPDHSGPLAVC